jgi:hypothetical protein
MALNDACFWMDSFLDDIVEFGEEVLSYRPTSLQSLVDQFQGNIEM